MRAVRALQTNLPHRSDPFSIIASEQLDPDMLLVHAADFLTIGWMRRYCAVLHHRAAGAKSNVLVAWKVTQGDADYAGAVCARLRNISHCILRPPAKDWEYGLYTMIHGTTAQDCERAITEISNLTGLRDFTALWTTRQYRKRRIPLFGDHEKRWEENV